MTREKLHQLMALVQRRQTELDNLEVKAARGGTPRRLFEALSAFANRTGGGVILFGLDEVKLCDSSELKREGKGRWSRYTRPNGYPQTYPEN